MEFLEFDGCFNFDMVIGQEVTRTLFNDKNFKNLLIIGRFWGSSGENTNKTALFNLWVKFSPYLLTLIQKHGKQMLFFIEKQYFVIRDNRSAGSFFFFSFFILIFSFNSFSKLAIHTLDNFPASRVHRNIKRLSHQTCKQNLFKSAISLSSIAFRTRVPGSIF